MSQGRGQHTMKESSTDPTENVRKRARRGDELSLGTVPSAGGEDRH